MSPPSVPQLRTKLFILRDLANQNDRILAGYKAHAFAVAQADTLASMASETGVRSTAELTPTEAAAHSALGDIKPAGDKYKPGPLRKAERIAHCIERATACITEAIIIADSAERIAPDERQRCIGTGDATGSTCTQWAATGKGGRCIDCHRAARAQYMRDYRRN